MGVVGIRRIGGLRWVLIQEESFLRVKTVFFFSLLM